MTFRVGQKVVCVQLLAHESAQFIPNRPVLNGIYTVRADALAYGQQYLFLEELRNPAYDWTEIGYGEPPFCHQLFRPIVERKTSISFAHEILRKASHKDRVRA